MSSPWLASKTPVGPPTSANPTVRQLVYAAVVTGAWSGIACLLVYLIGGLFGMSFTVAVRGGSDLLTIPWLVVLIVPLAAALLFALASSLLRGWPRAGSIVYWAGTLLAVASLALPLNQPTVGWPTRIVQALMHVITWFLVVPQIARIVGDSEPGKSVQRDE